MTKIKELVSEISHRPYPLPKDSWQYYQEWNDALFLHWAVSPELLRKLVPNGLELDLFEGRGYISLVAFMMEKIRPKYFPSISLVSDFMEVNIRTYVQNSGKSGVYFLSIEAAKWISTVITRLLSGLPYVKARMQRSDDSITSINTVRNFSLDVTYDVQDRIREKTFLDKWLTERYCLYLANGKEYYRYDIHHKEWPLQEVCLKSLKVNYSFGEFKIPQQPDCMHYSKGVEVIAWGKNRIL